MLRDPVHLLEHSRMAIDRRNSSEILECLSHLSVRDYEADDPQPEGLADIFDEDDSQSIDSTDGAEEETITLDSLGLWQEKLKMKENFIRALPLVGSALGINYGVSVMLPRRIIMIIYFFIDFTL
jgi:hypothetical protein